MPNDQIQPDHPLTAFSVPLEMLENVAGAVLPVACNSLKLCIAYCILLLCLAGSIAAAAWVSLLLF